MEDSVNERVKRLYEVERFRSNQKFAEAVGVSRETVRRWWNGERIASDNLENILKAFPLLNESWLRRGTGIMYNQSLNANPSFTEVKIQDISDVIRELKNEVERLEKDIQHKQTLIKVLEKQQNK